MIQIAGLGEHFELTEQNPGEIRLDTIGKYGDMVTKRLSPAAARQLAAQLVQIADQVDPR